jgi:predicted AAA+ superfamily ATPase
MCALSLNIKTDLTSGNLPAKITAMWQRSINISNHSFFLFGPRGVGKSTLLSTKFPNAKIYSLLMHSEYLKFLSDPDTFVREVLVLPKGSTIVIDEIQKVPQLLDSVHEIMNKRGVDFYQFVMTGSSARKLKNFHSNLLAGRALYSKLFPLTKSEINYTLSEVEDVISFGMLPAVRNLEPKDRVKFLESYVATYLQQEIQQEALAKNLDSFARFLKVAAIMNAQVINMSTIARDSGVARSSVQGYFSVLVDTLVADFLPAWQPKARVKEAQHPKFYFFDTGVVRTISGMVRDPLDSVEKGFLLETYIFHELRAHIEYYGIGGELSYWRSGNRELDFIWQRGKRRVGIEVKSSTRWRTEYSTLANELQNEGVIQKSFGIYLGESSQQDGSMKVLPLVSFIEELNGGEILK